MNQLFFGSICLTDLIDQASKGHSAFSKSPKNKKVYVNIATWLNEEPDKFGNIMSYQLSSTKEKRDHEEKVYIGNAKKFEALPVTGSDVRNDGFQNIPERESVTPTEPAARYEAQEDLPF